MRWQNHTLQRRKIKTRVPRMSTNGGLSSRVQPSDPKGLCLRRSASFSRHRNRIDRHHAVGLTQDPSEETKKTAGLISQVPRPSGEGRPFVGACRQAVSLSADWNWNRQSHRAGEEFIFRRQGQVRTDHQNHLLPEFKIHPNVWIHRRITLVSASLLTQIQLVSN